MYIRVAEYITVILGRKREVYLYYGDLMYGYKRLEYWCGDRKKMPNVIKIRAHKSTRKMGLYG